MIRKLAVYNLVELKKEYQVFYMTSFTSVGTFNTDGLFIFSGLLLSSSLLYVKC